jgi:DNA-3-methyladenine glycosylase
MDLVPAQFSAFFDRHVQDVARDLIGCRLYVAGAGGKIVETEAYGRNDEASHSYRGQTARNAAMFGRPGTSYLYRCYGIHWCFNIVCQPGTAVLLRAIEPDSQLDGMFKRRGTPDLRLLCSGPAKICQALQLDGTLNGHCVSALPFEILPRQGDVKIVSGVRIGISRAQHIPWRYGLAQSRYLSRPFENQSQRYRSA